MTQKEKKHPSDDFMMQLVTLNGVTKTVNEWTLEKKLKPNTVYKRRNAGCNWQEALMPVQKRNPLFSQYGVSIKKQFFSKTKP